ncbi:flagellar hook-length control protein FliK [Terribacillus aidingensis]|uniref:Flagellar hook-length control protein FliK n=1 Tax=Terribacillus aidingensis TaxID=586416 RepID=A0A285NJE8_9BACI|nr:flagellar hook-length control protein FliK [Terribacillus aidingensis]SNZ09634.1 flagellar hook-length control protein FliK [Terribacillus aidingensis]
MNNVITPLLPGTGVVKGQQNQSSSGDSLFQNLFQQVSTDKQTEFAVNKDSGSSQVLDVQDKQDIQVILEAFFDKLPDNESMQLKGQPENAWELMEQVLGADKLTAYLPDQIKVKAETILKEIKADQNELSAEGLLEELQGLQSYLINTDSNHSVSKNGMQEKAASSHVFLSEFIGDRQANTAAVSLQKTSTGQAAPVKETESNTALLKLRGLIPNSESNGTQELGKKNAPTDQLIVKQLPSNASASLQQSVGKQTVTETAKVIQSIVESSNTAGKSLLSNVAKQQQEEITPLDSKQVSNFQMSKQEQLVFHLKQADQVPHQAGKELVEKLEQAVKFSGILSDRNGMKELSIQLRPGNLGDLQVKLIRENGEITVQIIAASKQARDMLDSNISSLKHMFSPHQVSILERVDQPQESPAERNADQSFRDNADEERKDKQQEQQDNRARENTDFAFADILSEQKEIRI